MKKSYLANSANNFIKEVQGVDTSLRRGLGAVQRGVEYVATLPVRARIGGKKTDAALNELRRMKIK